MAELKRLLLALAVALVGCRERRPPAPVSAAASRPDAAVSSERERERCRREIAHAAVATVPGHGALETLVPTCGADGTIAVWTLRGHTLARLSRSREPGSTFAAPEVVATGADRLGPVAEDGAFGPLAWRSPTAVLEELQGDEWWAAEIDPTAPPEARVRSASVLMPSGIAGLGIVAPVGRSGAGVELLGSIARAGINPRVVHLAVRPPRNEVETLRQDPPALTEAELKAYEPRGQVALASALGPEGQGELRALAFRDGRLEERGRVPLSRRHVLVVSRGVAHGEASVFAFAEFDVVAPEQGPCLALAPSLCVQPGAITLLHVGANGVRTLPVAAAGLIDSLTLDERDRAVVFYVDADGAQRAQRAARVELGSGAVEPLVLAPAEALPPLDRPALVRCGREPWLAAEVMVSESEEATPESAVIVLPLACLTR